MSSREFPQTGEIAHILLRLALPGVCVHIHLISKGEHEHWQADDPHTKCQEVMNGLQHKAGQPLQRE